MKPRPLSYATAGMLMLMSASVLAGDKSEVDANHKAHEINGNGNKINVYSEPFYPNSASESQDFNITLIDGMMKNRYSVTPETVNEAHEKLLRDAAPEYRSELKKQLDIEARAIKQSGSSTVFHIKDEIVDVATGDFIILGTMSVKNRSGNEDASSVSPKAYRISVRFKGKDTRFTYFTEVTWIELTSPNRISA